MYEWIKETFGTYKPIIAMCHIRALPDDPEYDAEKGMDYVVECARKDLTALQDGGVDAVMFSNEFSIPYTSELSALNLCAMTRVITECKDILRIPFGIDCISCVSQSFDMAVALGAKFVRGSCTGTFVSATGFTNKNASALMRHRRAIGAQNIPLLSYVISEGAEYLGKRSIGELAKSCEFHVKMDIMLAAGLHAGTYTDTQDVIVLKNSVKKTPIFVNTGCKVETIKDQLEVADGAVVATTFKYDGIFENLVDYNRVKEFMDVVKEFRASKGL